MTTRNTAATIKRSETLGALAVGRSADLSVLEIVEEPYQVSDGYETVAVERRLRSVGCVRAGTWLQTAPSAPTVAA